MINNKEEGIDIVYNKGGNGKRIDLWLSTSSFMAVANLLYKQ